MEDDLNLLRRAQRGESVAFEVLVRRHSGRLWRLARALTPDDETAEEVVQDTFVKAHRSLGRFRGESAVATWLHTICHRTAIDRGRRARLRLLPLEPVHDTSVRRTLPDRLVVEEALAELGDDERTAFTLVAMLGYRSDETTEILGVPASTVRSRVARARRHLAEALTDDLEALA